MNNVHSNELTLSMRELALMGLLRSTAGFGLGLLLADSFSSENRKRVGWAVLLGSIGAGVPLGVGLMRKIIGRGAAEHPALG